MKKLFLFAGMAMLLVPRESVAVDLGRIGKAVETLGIESALDAAGAGIFRCRCDTLLGPGELFKCKRTGGRYTGGNQKLPPSHKRFN